MTDLTSSGPDPEAITDHIRRTYPETDVFASDGAEALGAALAGYLGPPDS